MVSTPHESPIDLSLMVGHGSRQRRVVSGTIRLPPTSDFHDLQPSTTLYSERALHSYSWNIPSYSFSFNISNWVPFQCGHTWTILKLQCQYKALYTIRPGYLAPINLLFMFSCQTVDSLLCLWCLNRLSKSKSVCWYFEHDGALGQGAYARVVVTPTHSLWPSTFQPHSAKTHSAPVGSPPLVSGPICMQYTAFNSFSWVALWLEH